MIKYKYLVILFIVFTLLGCTSNNHIDKYLSITFTHVTDEEDKFIMNNYSYDFKNKSVQKNASFDYNSQYPLTYYDKDNHKVYYAKRVGDSHNDEIYAYDCDTKESIKISNGIYAVNTFVKVSSNKIIAIAIDNHLPNLRLFEINTKTDDVHPMKIDGLDVEDFNIVANYYNQKDDSLYFAGYSYYEEWRLRDAYNNELIDDYEVNCFIYKYSFDDGKLVKILEDTGLGIDSLVVGNNKIYYNSRGMDAKEKGVFEYDLKNQSRRKLNELKNIYQLVCYDDVNNDILYIYNEYRGSSSLSRMNLETLEINSVFYDDIERQINNAFLGFTN